MVGGYQPYDLTSIILKSLQFYMQNMQNKHVKLDGYTTPGIATTYRITNGHTAKQQPNVSTWGQLLRLYIILKKTVSLDKEVRSFIKIPPNGWIHLNV